MILRALLLAWLLLLSPCVSALEPQADIEAFVRTGCPHCAQAETFLERLQREQPQLRIDIVDIGREPDALDRLQKLAVQAGEAQVRVPAIRVRDKVFIGYSEVVTEKLIREVLAGAQATQSSSSAASCGAVPSCGPDAETPAEKFTLDFFGHTLALDTLGLPLFTLAMGLLDGLNPCSMWVLILMISLLAQLNNRPRMLAIAGTFVAVEGIAYFLFMSAWLNLFLLIGLSRTSEIIIAALALAAGAINLKDFVSFGRGISLSIPASAKPGIYARMRRILHAENLAGAVIGTVLLAVLVQVVEFMCTSGFPALYTRILTLHHLDPVSYYGYLLLYDLAYMFDDLVVLAIGVVTLSQHRLQENEGRWLKLASGLAMAGLGLYLLLHGQ